MREQRTAKLTLNSVFDILKLIPLFTVSSHIGTKMIKSGTFQYFSIKSYVVDVYLNRLADAILIRPVKSPDLGLRLSAFSLHCRLSGFYVHFTGEIENLLAFFFR